ncbi:MAG: hypothetical protein HS115_00710 [Spirochaetales bacterium]|nr:hypothetical protein [Spirochaetales bacterium]
MTPDQLIVILLIAGPVLLGVLIIYVILDGRAGSQAIRQQNALLAHQTGLIVRRMKADTDRKLERMHRATQIALGMVLERVDGFPDDKSEDKE